MSDTTECKLSPENDGTPRKRKQNVKTGWRPISSAPKDGKPILVGGGLIDYDSDLFSNWMPFEGVAIAYWCKYDSEGRQAWRGENCGGHDEYCWHRPTHWQPLPLPPEPTP